MQPILWHVKHCITYICGFHTTYSVDSIKCTVLLNVLFQIIFCLKTSMYILFLCAMYCFYYMCCSKLFFCLKTSIQCTVFMYYEKLNIPYFNSQMEASKIHTNWMIMNWIKFYSFWLWVINLDLFCSLNQINNQITKTLLQHKSFHCTVFTR